ncbi:hypothetical protein NSA23_03525 [Anaerosalibacter massiliensis]|uniref:Uncharacterized protein n=1 Tax=Anaerosalibacter massiliensis TaxID=1347392 RepID=A0A9X2MHD4_9FIRM|nr:DUF6711 family protein [Anaerosalibacter massiliensis]MCR2043182.1 hypothetical protein [Anaerosalibacter massiliensis]
MATIKINGVGLPAPTKINIPRFDLDSGDTTRNEAGYMQRDRIRQGIYKIELEWRMLTSAEVNKIESLIQPSSVSVTFPTPRGMVTKRMYAGDRKIDMVVDSCWNMSFNLIEY